MNEKCHNYNVHCKISNIRHCCQIHLRITLKLSQILRAFTTTSQPTILNVYVVLLLYVLVIIKYIKIFAVFKLFLKIKLYMQLPDCDLVTKW